jgi:hypothetical protein
MPRLNLGRPIQRHIVRDLVGISAFGSSKGESPSSSHISKPRTPECRKCPESGPQYREAASAVHPQETPGARLGSSPFRPSRLRNARNSPIIFPMREVRECPGPGPTTSPSKFRASDLRGTRGTQLSHLGVSLIADVNKQGLTPSICERRKRFGNRHRVTARGHLGKKGAVQKGAKGVESSRRKDHRDLHAPSDPTSILVFAWSK